MDRRNFIRMASAAGLSVVAPSSFGGRDLSFGRRNDTATAGNKLFLCFNASGGWDPTHLCDAKTKTGPNDPNPMTNLLPEEVETSNGITYPAAFNPDLYGAGAGAFIPEFFRKHSGRLRIINGIDMQTNGHDTGSRHTWSGRLTEGAPTLAAYMAATYDPTLPMAFLSFGGFAETAGIAAQTRAGNLGALLRVAYPTRVDPEDETNTYHSDRAIELIEEAQWHRDMALLEGQRLPRIRHSMNTLYTARSGSNELRLLQEYLPSNDQLPDSDFFRSIQLALAAYQAGITIAANLNIGGFDTHGNHDQSQIPRLDELVRGIDYAWEEATRREVVNDIVIVVGSDFGRTPGYNDGNGKDHWSVSSMMLMGNGIEPGVVGETNEGHEAFGITPNLGIDRSSEPALRLEPGHVHQALRNKFAMGDGNPLAPLFPINLEPLSVLG